MQFAQVGSKTVKLRLNSEMTKYTTDRHFYCHLKEIKWDISKFLVISHRHSPGNQWIRHHICHIGHLRNSHDTNRFRSKCHRSLESIHTGHSHRLKYRQYPLFRTANIAEDEFYQFTRLSCFVSVLTMFVYLSWSHFLEGYHLKIWSNATKPVLETQYLRIAKKSIYIIAV